MDLWPPSSSPSSARSNVSLELQAESILLKFFASSRCLYATFVNLYLQASPTCSQRLILNIQTSQVLGVCIHPRHLRKRLTCLFTVQLKQPGTEDNTEIEAMPLGHAPDLYHQSRPPSQSVCFYMHENDYLSAGLPKPSGIQDVVHPMRHSQERHGLVMVIFGVRVSAI